MKTSKKQKMKEVLTTRNTKLLKDITIRNEKREKENVQRISKNTNSTPNIFCGVNKYCPRKLDYC